MKGALVVAGLVVATALLYGAISTQEGVFLTPSAVLSIGGQNIAIEIARAPSERVRGLSGVTALRANEGMLFVFEEEGTHSFWMKDMLFSIDILWLSAEGDVVHLEPSVSPDTYPTSFSSSVPARFVLEVPAGFSSTYGIKIGDRATLPQNVSQ